MRHFSWLITLPLGLALVVFLVNNRGAIALDLWPFDTVLAIPAYIVLGATLVAGFLVGAVVAWSSGGRSRRRSRQRRARIAELERALETARAESGSDEAARPATPPPAPTLPGSTLE